MNTILNDNAIFFKKIEEKIFAVTCEIARNITQELLEAYDQVLADERDKKLYRCKGKKKTTIKTIYGEVEYRRNVYATKTEEGKTACIFLLDQVMGMDKIGLFSTNLAEKILDAVTESPYRTAAEIISSTCGQSISTQGIWNMVQKLGERIETEENQAVEQMRAENTEGEKVIPVLFEEMDGVWLPMQDEKHKKMKKQEMKVFTMYEGWDEESEKHNRSSLVGKTMLAGMEKSEEFHEKREALIRKKYAADEITQRILNGDGGNWIKEPYAPEAIFQLDRYHIYQEILRKIRDKKAQKEIRQLFEEEKIEEMLEYIQIYATSVESQDEKDKTSKNAMELYKYLSNNREGLLPYQKRGITIPEPEPGIIYKNMGTQESQNCTVITLRMKHRRMRWSKSGANNMAKALYRKENKELFETIEKYTDGLIKPEKLKEEIEILSAAKAPKKDGKGNVYADIVNRNVPLFEAMQTAARKEFKRVFRQ